jgi:RNA polymerase sigma-70 factor (ECF subfamily)
VDEVAELIGSTVGGVKAALHRGRTKLAEISPPAKSSRSVDPELTQIIRLYVDRFNRHDWDGVRELIRLDARVNVADRFAGKLADAPYFSTYENVLPPWKLAAGEVDGQPVVVILKRADDTWLPRSIVRLNVEDRRINQIVDYWHCPWMLSSVTSLGVFG